MTSGTNACAIFIYTVCYGGLGALVLGGVVWMFK